MIQSGHCQTIVGGLLDRIRIEDADLIDAQNLYLMLGTSSAALIGLLFVATSPHLVEVVSSPAFRIRAYNVPFIFSRCGHACHVAVKAKDHIFHPYQKR
jgi:hypothetical protein